VDGKWLSIKLDLNVTLIMFTSQAAILVKVTDAYKYKLGIGLAHSGRRNKSHQSISRSEHVLNSDLANVRER
jgi:hypothetical protein